MEDQYVFIVDKALEKACHSKEISVLSYFRQYKIIFVVKCAG